MIPITLIEKSGVPTILPSPPFASLPRTQLPPQGHLLPLFPCSFLSSYTHLSPSKHRRLLLPLGPTWTSQPQKFGLCGFFSHWFLPFCPFFSPLSKIHFPLYWIVYFNFDVWHPCHTPLVYFSSENLPLLGNVLLYLLFTFYTHTVSHVFSYLCIGCWLPPSGR